VFVGSALPPSLVSRQREDIVAYLIQGNSARERRELLGGPLCAARSVPCLRFIFSLRRTWRQHLESCAWIVGAKSQWLGSGAVAAAAIATSIAADKAQRTAGECDPQLPTNSLH
jgi:hypothetical protein